MRWADREFDPRAEALAQKMGAAQMNAALTAPVLVPAETTVGNPAINIGIFALFVRRDARHRDPGLTQQPHRGRLLRRWVARSPGGRTASRSRATTSRRPRSSESPGPSPINGYDGFLYSIGFLVAWLVALLLVAELLRNVGKYTMADVLSFRLRQRPVRIAAAISTLVVSFFYLLAQMAGAGGLVALLLGVEGALGQRLVIVVVGVIMLFYVIYGGMKGTTWVQIIKAVLLIIGAIGHDGVGAGQVRLSTSRPCSVTPPTAAPAAADGTARDLLSPGLQYKNPVDFISLALALVLGTAGLPHVLMRFYTVPTSREARKSVEWAIWLIGLFYLLHARTRLRCGRARRRQGHQGGARRGQLRRAPLLAFELGGEILLGIISAVAFATILAVVAGLTITASASLSHDIYNTVVKDGKATPEEEVKVARSRSSRARRRRHRRGHLRPRPEHRVPRGSRLRRRGEREPADDPVLALLEAVQHPGRAVQHLRRPDQRDHPHRVLAGRLGQAPRPRDR